MKKHLITSSLLLLLLAVPSLMFAQNFEPLTNLPGIQDAATATSLPNFLNILYKLCIGAAAVIAVLQIMRAGAKFMYSKGSITQNQEAKGLIQNSVLGLLLVLSPAIVFGIINPDILDLKLDISDIKLQDLSTPPGQDTSVGDTRCELYEIGSATGHLSCSTIGEGYTSISSQCCEGSVVGSICCARPKTNPQQAANKYMWRFTPQSQSGAPLSGTPFGTPPPSPRESRLFDNQQACRDDFVVAVGVARLNGEVTVECNCSKPGGYPACKI